MANLRESDRGQIVLVAAFILATSFVVLALVVNSAIFTENLATRGDVAGANDALQYRHEVESSVGTVMSSTNANNNTAESYLKENASANVENVSQISGFQQSSLGRIVNVTYETGSEHMGHRIAMDNTTDRDFTSDAGAQDWTLAENIDSTRNFEIAINWSQSSFSNDFTVDLDDSADSWNVTLSGDTATDDLDVTVRQPGTTARTCSRDVSGMDTVTVDLTEGVVAGEPCPALRRASDGTRMWLAEGIGNGYSIEFQNGNEMSGTYSLVVNNSADGDIDPVGTHLEDIGQDGEISDSPYYTDALYRINVSYEYRTHSVAYETTIEVAPGETPA